MLNKDGLRDTDSPRLTRGIEAINATLGAATTFVSLCEQIGGLPRGTFVLLGNLHLVNHEAESVTLTRDLMELALIRGFTLSSRIDMVTISGIGIAGL